MQLRFRQEPSSLYTFPDPLMKRPKLTRERLVAAVNESTSFRQVLIRLDVAPYGGNYGVLRRALTRHNIDTSQFVGRAWNRGRRLMPRKPGKPAAPVPELPRTDPNLSKQAKDRGLARYCSHPERAAVPPNLTPFTQSFPHLSAQLSKSLASTNFATQA